MNRSRKDWFAVDKLWKKIRPGCTLVQSEEKEQSVVHLCRGHYVSIRRLGTRRTQGCREIAREKLPRKSKSNHGLPTCQCHEIRVPTKRRERPRVQGPRRF